MFRTNKRLYYFTGPQFALDIVVRRHLKISFANDVNDIFEMMPFDFGKGPKAKHFRRAWRKSIDKISEKSGFISFSEGWDVPSMWGHYAQNHQGICFGFDITGDLTQIQYVSEFEHYDCKTKDTFAEEPVQSFDYAQKTKSKHWEFENEWRLFVTLTEQEQAEKRRGANLFFLSFDKNIVLKEIIIGQNSNLSSKQFCQALGDYSKVKIKTARPSFRGYKMVEQKRVSLQK